jgi:hypothetical protein
MRSNSLDSGIHNRILDLVSSQGELRFDDIIRGLRLDPQDARNALYELIRDRRLKIKVRDGLRRFSLGSCANLSTRAEPALLGNQRHIF